MDNEFHTLLGPVPIKETVEFAKNLGFVYTFQSLATVLTTAHNGVDPPWTNDISAALITLIGGTLTAMVIDLYLRHWQDLPRRTSRLAFALFILAGILVQKVTGARIAEGW